MSQVWLQRYAGDAFVIIVCIVKTLARFVYLLLGLRTTCYYSVYCVRYTFLMPCIYCNICGVFCVLCNIINSHLISISHYTSHMCAL